MRYPWPVDDSDHLLRDALDIAVGYLEDRGLAHDHVYVTDRAARTIMAEWRKGVRHEITLAYEAIVAVEAEVKGKYSTTFTPAHRLQSNPLNIVN